MEGAKKAGMFQTILGAVMVVAGIAISCSQDRGTFAAGLMVSGGVNDGWWNLPDAFAHNPKDYRGATILTINPLMPSVAQ
jgi:hypothetical protein